MSLRFLRGWLLLAVVALTACNHSSAPAPLAQPGGATPSEAAQQLVERLKQDDFIGYWHDGLPAADFKTMQADWTLSQQMPQNLKPAESARMNAWLAQFNAPDAQHNLQAQWLPKLAGLQRQYADQIPMLMSVMQMVAGTAIDQSTSLTDSEKKPLHDIVNVIGPWAGKVAWFDRDKAKQGIAVSVETIHSLGLSDVQSLHQLDFEPAMRTYARFFKGLKQVLAIYGLDLNASLNSTHISATPIDADHAQLSIEYSLLGKPLTISAQAIQIQHRWFIQSLIDAVHDAHQRLQTPAPSASSAAPGATPAPSASSHS